MTKKACDCGSIDYNECKIGYTEEGRYMWCNMCSTQKVDTLIPDVYFDKSKGANQIDPNLCDRYKGPIQFSSKREKAIIMRQLGLREAGDREHGSRNFDKKASKQWDKF